MQLDFRAPTYTSHITYTGGGLAQLQQAILGVDANEFVVNQAPNATNVYSLASRSASTRGQATTTDIHFATNFFGGFEQMDAWDSRQAYILRKQEALVETLINHQLTVQMLGSTAIFRAEVPLEEMAAAKSRLIDRVLAEDTLLGGNPPYDFTMRLSHELGDTGFLNTYVSSFENRTIPFVPSAAGIGSIRPWDGALVGAGFEIRFDINNKRGLYDGKLAWDWKELSEVLVAGLDGMRVRFDQVRRMIGAALNGTKEEQLG